MYEIATEFNSNPFENNGIEELSIENAELVSGGYGLVARRIIAWGLGEAALGEISRLYDQFGGGIADIAQEAAYDIEDIGRTYGIGLD